MIRIGILGDIGSGKSFVAKLFGYPVFNADNEVGKIYKKNRVCFLKLKRSIPEYIKTFPIDKTELSNAILGNKNNLKKITKDQATKEIEKLKKDLFNFRFQKVNGQVKNYSKINETKKDIARLKTFLGGKNA